MTIFDSQHFLKRFLQFFREVPFESIFAAWGIVTVAWAVIPRMRRKWQRKSDIQFLHSRLGATVFTSGDLYSATRYYVQPDCQNIDPAGEENWRRDSPVRQPVFSKFDQLFANPDYRHTILLADTGMGKTSLLLSYYVRSRRKHSRHQSIAVLPLGHPKVTQLIGSIANKPNTILMLDAFDEDTKVKDDHMTRLLELLDLTSEFRHVLISCRTQFFRSDEEIPRETGIMRFGPTGGNQEHQYIFHKLYLSPFDEVLVERYLRKRWPIWHRSLRNDARLLCRQVGDLALRPMILTNIEALIESDKGNTNNRPVYEHSFQIYERIIDYWISRESAFFDGPSLKSFSERVAAKIYSQREKLQSERLPFSEAEEVARECNISLQERQIRSHSLLNRDADGRLKFAHRSIMEFLYVSNFIAQPAPQPQWTDQMAKFYLEISLFDVPFRLQQARVAAIHADIAVRQRLADRILESQPESLRNFSVSLGTTPSERLSDNIFLIILGGPSLCLAISKRALPGEFVNSTHEEFATYFDIPIIGRHKVMVNLASAAYHETLQRHYCAAFPNLKMTKIWQGGKSYDPRRQNMQSLHIAYALSLQESLSGLWKAAGAP